MGPSLLHFSEVAVQIYFLWRQTILVKLVKIPQPPSRENRAEQYTQADSIEDTLNVQVHHFCESAVRMGIELLPPRSPGIRK